MLRINQLAHAAFLIRETADRPEIGRKLGLNRMRQRLLCGGRREIHFPARGEHLHGFFIQARCLINGRGANALCLRIEPERIAVFMPGKTHLQLDLLVVRSLRQCQADQACFAKTSLLYAPLTAAARHFPAVPGHAPCQAACEILFSVVRDLHHSFEHFPGLIGVFLQFCQRQHIPEKGLKAFRPCKGVRLGAEVTVEHAHQGCSLTREILQSQQGNTRDLRRPEIGLHLLPIAQKGKLAGRFHALLPVLCHPGLFRFFPDCLKIVRPCHAVEIIDLRKIRQHFVLSDFEGNNRARIGRPQRMHALGVVHAFRRPCPVHMPGHA